MELINFEVLKAGTTAANSDRGSEVARKINDNFDKVLAAFDEVVELKYIVSATTKDYFPSVGKANTIYLATAENDGEGCFYWWDEDSSIYKAPTLASDFNVINGGNA